MTGAAVTHKAGYPGNLTAYLNLTAAAINATQAQELGTMATSAYTTDLGLFYTWPGPNGKIHLNIEGKLLNI